MLSRRLFSQCLLSSTRLSGSAALRPKHKVCSDFSQLPYRNISNTCARLGKHGVRSLKQKDLDEFIKDYPPHHPEKEAVKPEDDPLGIIKLDVEIGKANAWLRNELGKIRAFGGQWEPSQMENTAVAGDNKGDKIMRLGDIAHVAQNGKFFVITVNEVTDVKKVSNAVNKFYKILPQIQDPKVPNVLTLRVPPPTKEARVAATVEADKVAHRAKDTVRDFRNITMKKIRGLKSSKAITPDEVKKLENDIRGKIDRQGAIIRDLLEATRTSLIGAKQ